MPRDLPPIAQPALNFTQRAQGVLRYGGRPRLPADIDWPVSRDRMPLHFVVVSQFEN